MGAPQGASVGRLRCHSLRACASRLQRPKEHRRRPSRLQSPAPVRRVLPTAPALLLLTACANIQQPPGGPPDTTPPKLASVFPESLAVLPGFKGDVEFRFNKVISEGSSPNQGRGTGDLEKLVILSPTDRVPHVSWHRYRISVHPAEGWKPNRVYRVELLPGVTDVRQNRSKAEAVVTFTTGAQLPHDTLTGQVFDWKSGTPGLGALVEAVLEPDSLPYRTLADSAGKFSFGPLPHGEYLVYGVLDQNRNNRRDPREAFDTVRVRPESAKVAVPELYAFVHDTFPPRIQQITPIDSVSATITFAQSLDPFQKLDTSAASVIKLPDSTAVPVVGLTMRETAGLPGAEPTLMRPADTAAARARLDTTALRQRLDSALLRRVDSLRGQAAAPPGVPGPGGVAMGRPPLSDRLTLTVGKPWHPGDRFLVGLTGVRTVSGQAGNPHGVLTIPEQKPPLGAPGIRPDSAAADSMRRRLFPDSTRLRPRLDSLRRRQP